MARINNVPTIIMKAIVIMNNENLTVNVSGITISLDTQEMEEGASTLISFLEAVVPEDCKADMLKDMTKVRAMIGFISRYRSCFHFSNGQELKQTITLDKNGMMETQWNACNVSFDFKEFSKLLQEFNEFQVANIRSQERWDEEEDKKPLCPIVIPVESSYSDLKATLKETGDLNLMRPTLLDYIDQLGNETGSKSNSVKCDHIEKISNHIEEYGYELI